MENTDSDAATKAATRAIKMQMKTLHPIWL